jgi:hemerythrin-like domain-containing protein
MKATELLTEQHEEVAGLFKVIEQTDQTAEKKAAFKQLAAKLAAHDAIERKIFYPACEEAMGLNDDLGEALVEHGVVEFALYLANEAVGKPDFDFKCKVLKELVEHHVEEEQDDFFPKVEKALGEDRLLSLGEDMEDAFDEALAEDFQQPLFENLRQVLAGVLEPSSERKPATRSSKSA